jgi:hypothetical protein
MNEWMNVNRYGILCVNIGDTYIDINLIVGLGISEIAQVPNLIRS